MWWSSAAMLAHSGGHGIQTDDFCKEFWIKKWISAQGGVINHSRPNGLLMQGGHRATCLKKKKNGRRRLINNGMLTNPDLTLQIKYVIDCITTSYYIYNYIYMPYGSKHFLRRYLTPKSYPKHFLRRYGWIHRHNNIVTLFQYIDQYEVLWVCIKLSKSPRTMLWAPWKWRAIGHLGVHWYPNDSHVDTNPTISPTLGVLEYYGS